MIYIILVYLVSVYFNYKYVQIAYSKKGRWSPLNPTFGDIVLTFMPFLNTLNAVVSWMMFYPKRQKTDYSKFFKIKR